MAALAKGASEAEIIKYIGDHYGADIAAFLNIPDLRRVIIEAAQNDYSPQLVSTKLRRTRWYQDRSETMRTMDALKVSDPKQYAKLLEAKRAELKHEMMNLGLERDTNAVSEAALRFGWNDAQVREQLTYKAAVASAVSGLAEGSSVDTVADKLMSMARNDYLTPVDRQTAEKWAIRAYQTNQQNVEEAWRGYLSQLANTRFGLDPGADVTPADIMSPVKVAIGEALEIAPESIDLLDPRYAEVMQVQTSDGRMRPMTGYEATKWARSQDGFRQTKVAQDDTAKLVEQLGQTFGMVK